MDGMNPGDPGAGIAAAELREVVAAVLDTLRPADAAALRLRFGLDGNDEHSFEEIAAATASSPEAVRSRVDRALRLLRYPARANRLRPYWGPAARMPQTIPDPVRLRRRPPRGAVPEAFMPLQVRLLHTWLGPPPKLLPEEIAAAVAAATVGNRP